MLAWKLWKVLTKKWCVLYRMFIVQAYQTSQYVVPHGGIFLGKWHCSFAGNSDGRKEWPIRLHSEHPVLRLLVCFMLRNSGCCSVFIWEVCVLRILHWHLTSVCDQPLVTVSNTVISITGSR
jgi:hypothetical protein